MKFLLDRASKMDNYDGKDIDTKFNPRIEEYKTINSYEEIRKACFIDINNLEEFMEFYKLYGEIVIREHFFNKNINEILIYDSYIE